MSYLVFCTFDLKNGSTQDYKNAYEDLARLGLTRVHKTDAGGNAVIPTTSAMGFLNGTSAVQVGDNITVNVRSAFAARGFKSEIFVVVGGDWVWRVAAS